MKRKDVTESRSALTLDEIEPGHRSDENPASASSSSTVSEPVAILAIPKWRRIAGVMILSFINLLNYMDRFTIAGVLMQVTSNFEINNADAGLLQTSFIVGYMMVAPLFGYLGDRYNRIWIMASGLGIWFGLTLLSSFIKKPEHFALFVLSRTLVGIGGASYSTIAPTFIGDMFVGVKRTQMLSVFFFATPIGGGLGYIVGAAVARAFGGWEWALRVTPGLGVVAIILLLFVCPNPPRGASETKMGTASAQHSYLEDIKYLTHNKSFIWVTLGFTFMAFVFGSLTLWGPSYFSYSQIAIGVLPPCQDDNCDNADISFIFGLITCIAGFGGVGIGAESARRWKLRGTLNADALVCAIGLFLGAPLLLVGVQLAQIDITVAWIFIFFANLCLCFTWTLFSDMTLYVTEPNRRSTANAAQLLIGHLFGDAGSPYLLGLVADSIAEGMPDTYTTKYLSLQRSMYITLFVCIIGAGSFLMASLTVVKDKKKVEDFLKTDSSKTNPTSGSVELNQRSHGTLVATAPNNPGPSSVLNQASPTRQPT